MQNKLSIKEKSTPLFPFRTPAASPLKKNQPATLKKQDKVKLWQLDHNYHCAIIGTCLTLDEVKKILRQLHISTNGFSPYELHTSIVTLISENKFPSKKVQNHLDKKFKPFVQKTNKMNAAELKGFWKAALYCGDMIGAFWAVMSHPASNEEIKRAVYGDIHMLSHMSGASNRADLKRLTGLEQARKNHIVEMQIWESKCNKLRLEKDRLLNLEIEHHGQISDLENHVNALKNSLEQLMILQSTKERQELEALVEKLSNKLNCRETDITKQENKEKQLSALTSRLEKQLLNSNDERLALKNEVQYLQSALTETAETQCPLKSQNLCGQCVLYVGGKTNLVPFYRELVEEKAGIFIHHDGGMEKNTQDLQKSLSKADVVVFPASCISHDAYWKIKRVCKKQHKPYQYLQSSGLYSLSSMLDKIMAKSNAPRLSTVQ